MLLQNKNALVYGGGGLLGGAIARAFANAGAHVFVTGRHISPVKKLVGEILASGGKAEAAEVNALDQQAINNHIEGLAARFGAVDISFNAIGIGSPPNTLMINLSLDEFLDPINLAMKSQFLTATAAARVMVKQGSGVILSITSTAGGTAYPMLGPYGPIQSAIESFSRSLASELGPYGVRVVNIRSGGSPDSGTFVNAMAQIGEVVTNNILKKLADDTMLKMLPMVADIANVSVFLASDKANKITGTTIDVTCGTTNALNYKPNFQKHSA
jgi:3-oxoacyl-[acyl-carrier protein] reductase